MPGRRKTVACARRWERCLVLEPPPWQPKFLRPRILLAPREPTWFVASRIASRDLKKVRGDKLVFYRLTNSSFQVYADPEASFDDFEPLHLVCRSFNAIWCPTTLCRIWYPFVQRHLGRHLQQLRQPASNPEHLKQIRVLTLENWHLLNDGAAKIQA